MPMSMIKDPSKVNDFSRKITQRCVVKCIIHFLILIILIISYCAYAQQPDSKKVFVSNGLDSLKSDTTKIIEDAALDIAQNRGFFIVTPDSKMQLRILGSVRYLVVFDDTDLPFKNFLNTYQIPVGDQVQRIFNYYSGLDQSRLGFEVTRHTKNGIVFVRLEADFAGTNGFRIRHAYGQYGQFLIGQSWSLFSQITSLPATVDFVGPTGSITVRTPQIRYTSERILPSYKLSFGLEYFKPRFTIPDSIIAKSFQLIPDITARTEKSLNWGLLQLSGLFSILSGITEKDKVVLLPGWGVSLSAVINSWATGKWYLQATGGKGITRYYSDLSRQNMDLLYDPESNKSYLPHTFGASLTYEHTWSPKVFSNFTYSTLLLENYSFTPDDAYHRGNSFRFNSFWDVVEGAKVGAEFIHAIRKNKGNENGSANRVNLLFYYDF